MELRTLFTNPDAFFEERVKYRGIGIPIVLLLGVGVLRMGEWLAVHRQFVGTEAQPNYEALILILAIMFLLEPLLVWAGLSTITYIVGRLLGGRMRLEILFPVISWGFIAYAGTALSWTVGRYLSLRDQPPCANQQISCEVIYEGDLSDQFSQITAYMAEGVADPVYVGFFVLGAAFLVWAVHLWSRALENASTLDRTRSVLAVSVPVILYFVVTVSSVFPSLG